MTDQSSSLATDKPSARERDATLEDQGVSKDQAKEDAANVKDAAAGDGQAATGLATTADAGPEPSDQHRSDHVQIRTGSSGDRPDQLSVTDRAQEPFYGHFVTVVAGEHEGAYGVYYDNVTFDANGKPDVILVRTRDADNRQLEVRYADVRPAESRGNAPR